MSMTQGFFLSGFKRRATAHTHFKKYLGPRRHSPKEMRLRRQALNLTSPMRVKASEDDPLRPEGNPVPRHTRPELCSWHHGRPKCPITTGEAHQTRRFGQWYLSTAPPSGWVVQRPFKVGLGAGPEPRHALHFPKYLRLNRHSPKERYLRRQAINLTAVKRVKTLGDAPCVQRDLYSRGTPGQIPDNTVGWSATQQLERRTKHRGLFSSICCATHRTDKCDTRPFLR